METRNFNSIFFHTLFVLSMVCGNVVIEGICGRVVWHQCSIFMFIQWYGDRCYNMVV